jgi:hypothetical protein
VNFACSLSKIRNLKVSFTIRQQKRQDKNQKKQLNQKVMKNKACTSVVPDST